MPPLAPAALPVLLSTLWRDPHTVESEEILQIIQRLEHACAEYPDSADLHTCLGMAHAINHDAYRSIDALERACRIDPTNFWAQLKFSEVYYRLRALPRAERETKLALNLAADAWQIAIARRQLQEIRRLMREGMPRPEWTRPLSRTALFCAASALLVACLVVLR
ncbi:MAG: hypothetical protein HY821_11480 [Acidobacteria bacterium]|nr:hypothetical protein [Acidobacteriota bacterium]